jgi:hypothetical protein
MASKEMFTIVNSVRRVETRIRRAAAPTRARFKQYVCGRRLLRKQSIKVSPEDMKKYEQQLREQLEAGAIRIFDPSGIEILPPGYQAPGRPFIRATSSREMKAPTPEPKSAAPEPVSPPEPEPEPETAVDQESPEADDLTSLQGVGAGRVSKLANSGITTFKRLAGMDPKVLAKLLGSPMTETQASALIEAAKKKVG